MNLAPSPLFDRRILAVEDEVADLELLRKSLARVATGAELTHALNGRDAIESLRSSDVKPDLILLDLNMPIMDGFETLLELKADLSLRAIPVVVFTSSDRAEDVTTSYKRLANCYVKKPIGLTESKRTLQAICDFWFKTAKPIRSGTSLEQN